MTVSLPAVIVSTADGAKFSPATYNRMRSAIEACTTIDDCNEAQSRALAMQAYYAQIHDDDAWDAMREIRLRAWRRMSEIITAVDVSGCERQKDMVAKVRHDLGAEATAMLSDSRIIELIKLGGVPDAGFEESLRKSGVRTPAAVIMEAHPNEIRKRKEMAENAKRNAILAERIEQEQRERIAQEREERTRELEGLCKRVAEEAIVDGDEVGLTLHAEMQEHLMRFSIIMDKKMHEQLRDAAHEKRTTMWAIMREACNYWFVVNGYNKV